jgi:hypothetical protein
MKRLVLAILVTALPACGWPQRGQPRVVTSTITVPASSFFTAQTSSLCIPGTALCQQHAVEGQKIVITRSDGLFIVWQKSFDAYRVISDGEGENVRRFSQFPNTIYPARFAPLTLPAIINAPIVKASAVINSSVTPGSKALFYFQPFYVTTINRACQAAGNQGAIYSSSWIFFADSFDFGGEIGVRKNVLVYESVSGYPPGATDPMHGQRLERYWFLPGMGWVREEGWDDPICRATSTTSACQGDYSSAAPGAATWSISGPAIVPALVCAN